MHYENFLDNLIPDRVYLIREFGDPMHIHQLLCKNLSITMDESEKRYSIKIDTLRNEITFEGESEYLIPISTLAIRKRVTIVSFSQYGLILNLEEFINRVI